MNNSNIFFMQLLLGTNTKFKNEDIEALYYNNIEFVTEFYRLLNIFASAYGIDGLPELMDLNQRVIFLGLLTNTRVDFFYDETDDLICLPSSPNGVYDKFGNSITKQAIDYNGNTYNLDDKDSVTMYIDTSRTNAYPLALYKTAKRLADITRTCDVRMIHHKNALSVYADESDIYSQKTKFNKIKNNVPVIFNRKSELSSVTSDSDKENEIESHDISFLNIDLMDYYHEIENNFFALLGINFAKANKKERMIESEINANNEQILANREVILENLQKGCDELNKKFGLNAKAYYKFDTITKEEQDFNNDGSHDKTKGIVSGGDNNV
mgnify:CR=1 FL=1